MANGAQISEEHDRILHAVPKTTGKPVAHWYKKLDEAGVQRRGFLAALNFLRDNLRVPHQQASALAWSFFNPSMVPDDLVAAARAASGVVEKATIDPLARRAAAIGDDGEPEIAPRAAKKGSGSKSKPAPKAAAKKPAAKKPAAKKPAAKKPAAKKAAAKKPAPKKPAGKVSSARKR